MLDTPPLTRHPGHSFYAIKRRKIREYKGRLIRFNLKLFTLILLQASMKSIPYVLCSSMPVAIVRILGSKMMSLGLNPTLSTSNL